MKAFSTIYEICMTPHEEVERLAGARDMAELSEMVAKALETSLDKTSAWMDENGYNGESKVDLTLLSHDAMHQVFDTCTVKKIAAILALAAMVDEEAGITLLANLFSIGFVMGSAFTLEAQQQTIKDQLPDCFKPTID